MAPYGFIKKLPLGMEEAEQKVRDALDAEGFGVLVKIDMAAKLREKLGVDMADYIILGACNPPNAHKAVVAEPDIGLLLPCNVILRREGEDTIVGIIKPSSAMGMVENDELGEVAGEVEMKLTRVFEAL